MILTAFFVINGIYHISRLNYFDIAHKVRHAHVIYTVDTIRLAFSRTSVACYLLCKTRRWVG